MIEEGSPLKRIVYISHAICLYYQIILPLTQKPIFHYFVYLAGFVLRSLLTAAYFVLKMYILYNTQLRIYLSIYNV